MCWSRLTLMSSCELYSEDAPAAWDQVERAAKVVAGGGAAFTRNQLANFYYLRGQVALAMAEKSDRAARQRLLASVTAEIDALLRHEQFVEELLDRIDTISGVLRDGIRN